MALEARLTAQFSALEALEDEQQLVSAFLTTSLASQRLLTLKLLANPAIERFPELLRFFLRVMMAVHARSHVQQENRESSTCSYASNTAQGCISFEQEENSGSSVTFQLPESFQACLAMNFGSVKRLKCEEVWHGDHMAYRCRTCGLSDSSCMCLACYADPEEHEGHDYRVYRCSSGGCCDCGDPLAWNPEGFCMKHSAKKENEQREDRQNKMKMDPEENEVVQMLVRRAMDFCVEALREVYLACLRPHASMVKPRPVPPEEIPTQKRSAAFGFPVGC
ncbi:hypothetical protein DVH05_018988 [Phytophthora capsici]|nr:hypothetical protein DVH05_018988 [Phytophthora capsici]